MVLTIAAVVGLAAAAPPPPPNVTECEVESCVVSPTDCGGRAECRGCGALCFNPYAGSPSYGLLLNYTGLSEQATGAQVFPDLPAPSRPPGPPPQCPWPTKKECIRGAGADKLRQYKPTDSESKSESACCAACAALGPSCAAWQLITKNGQAAPCCWLMAENSVKTDSPDSCVSGAPPAPQARPEPEIRTADAVLLWAAVEPSPGLYNWSSLTAMAGRARRANGKLSVLLWTGQDAPHWLYGADVGVPMLAHDKGAVTIVPDYTSSQYQRRLRAVHTSMAAELRTQRISPFLMALQPCVGSTGDDTPIHVTSGSGHTPGWVYVNKTLLARINGPAGAGAGNVSWWSNFTREFSLWLATNETAFAGPVQRSEMVLLLNGQGSSFPLDWVAANLPGSYLKFGQTGHEYQSNGERYRVAQQAPFIYGLQRGRPVRSRAELSSETCWTCPGPFCNVTACPAGWNVYAMAMWVASAHLDFWNVQPSAVAGVLPGYRPVWRFLNRYAGMRWAWQSAGAWIGFRDGLDGLDTVRFPEAEYGPLQAKQGADGYPQVTGCDDAGNTTPRRAHAICTAHANQGCAIDQTVALCGGPMVQRRAHGMNDVAFGNWRGDYGGFLRQRDPAASRGWWRVGDRTELFGRFARGFADPGNASAVLPLELDRGLWGGLPLAAGASRNLTLRVIFLDEGRGSFSVGYDSQRGPRALLRVAKTGSGRWRELCAPVPDGRFGGGGPGGGDVWLANEDTNDDIFDSLELAEGNPAELAVAGCDLGYDLEWP